MCRSDGKCLKGSLCVLWQSGKYLVWDVAVVSSLADCYGASAVREAGLVAELAASKKMDKYTSLAVAFEMLGPNNKLAFCFLTVVAHKIRYIYWQYAICLDSITGLDFGFIALGRYMFHRTYFLLLHVLYVICRTQVHCIIAVDFTASNGDPRSPQSLHHLDPYKPNLYARALRAVGEIIQDYDRYRTVSCLSHCVATLKCNKKLHYH